MAELTPHPVRAVAMLVELSAWLGFVVGGNVDLPPDFPLSVSKGALVTELAHKPLFEVSTDLGLVLDPEIFLPQLLFGRL